MKKRKIMSAALVLSLAGFVLSGCNGGAPAGKDNSATQKENSSYTESSMVSTADLKKTDDDNKKRNQLAALGVLLPSSLPVHYGARSLSL